MWLVGWCWWICPFRVSVRCHCCYGGHCPVTVGGSVIFIVMVVYNSMTFITLVYYLALWLIEYWPDNWVAVYLVGWVFAWVAGWVYIYIWSA